MTRYKPDQGRLARMAAFWSLAFMAFFGCSSLENELGGRFDALGSELGLRLPILGIELTGAFLIATVLFLGLVFFLYRWLERPKAANLLIDTEAELHKVTWPSGPEVVNSSLVVVFSVLFLMAFLAFSDWIIGHVTRRLLGL